MAHLWEGVTLLLSFLGRLSSHDYMPQIKEDTLLWKLPKILPQKSLTGQGMGTQTLRL